MTQLRQLGYMKIQTKMYSRVLFRSLVQENRANWDQDKNEHKTATFWAFWSQFVVIKASGKQLKEEKNLWLEVQSSSLFAWWRPFFSWIFMMRFFCSLSKNFVWFVRFVNSRCSVSAFQGTLFAQLTAPGMLTSSPPPVYVRIFVLIFSNNAPEVLLHCKAPLPPSPVFFLIGKIKVNLS